MYMKVWVAAAGFIIFTSLLAVYMFYPYGEMETKGESEEVVAHISSPSGNTRFIVQLGKNIRLNASASSGPIVRYHWNMGDGTELEGMEVKHAYEDVGTYAVLLTVYSASGGSDTDLAYVHVYYREWRNGTVNRDDSTRTYEYEVRWYQSGSIVQKASRIELNVTYPRGGGVGSQENDLNLRTSSESGNYTEEESEREGDLGDDERYELIIVEEQYIAQGGGGRWNVTVEYRHGGNLIDSDVDFHLLITVYY